MLPQDLVKFGMIPEFVGRVPGGGSSGRSWMRTAMVRILTEPKNAIVKQYKKLFELDGVKLTFEREATGGIAEKSVKRKTGSQRLAGHYGRYHDGYHV